MKIVFLSNFLNHHQIPFCQSMQKLTDGGFYFVQTERVNAERRNMGYGEFEDKYPFLICPYADEKTKKQTEELIKQADFVIIGSAPESYIEERLKQNKPVIRYSEPFLREQNWRQFTPKSLLAKYKQHTRYAKKNVFVLCSGCYTASDFAVFGAYIGKTYQWGYFPPTYDYDIDELMAKKRKDHVEIVWVGRFLPLKHPEMILNTAKRLKKDQYSFSIKLIGSGENEQAMKRFIKENSLEEHVLLLGNMSPEDVRANMETANIFMFNSDHREGWGAVVNEAMNSGCAVISSQGPGSTGFLIDHKQNGLVYNFKSFESLYKNVKCLFDDENLREKLGKNAYKTIVSTWNAETAAENLYDLVCRLKAGKDTTIENGPCSKAPITPRRSMYRRLTKGRQ
jgi:glycosyltransferase involved in cell wall biosynthesis